MIKKLSRAGAAALLLASSLALGGCWSPTQLFQGATLVTNWVNNNCSAIVVDASAAATSVDTIVQPSASGAATQAKIMKVASLAQADCTKFNKLTAVLSGSTATVPASGS